MHKWNEPHLLLLPSHTASPHFGWYSFPDPLGIRGLVGLKVGGMAAEKDHPSEY